MPYQNAFTGVGNYLTTAQIDTLRREFAAQGYSPNEINNMIAQNMAASTQRGQTTNLNFGAPAKKKRKTPGLPVFKQSSGASLLGQGSQRPPGPWPGGQDSLSSTYQDASDAANKANQERFDFGMTGQLDLLQALMDQAKGFGAGEEARLDEAYQAASSRGQQDVINRGMTGTTIRGSVERGHVRDRESAKTALNAQLAQMLAEIKGNYGQRVLDFSERRTDQGPDLNQMIALASQDPGGQAAPTGIYPNSQGGYGDPRQPQGQPGGGGFASQGPAQPNPFPNGKDGGALGSIHNGGEYPGNNEELRRLNEWVGEARDGNEMRRREAWVAKEMRRRGRGLPPGGHPGGPSDQGGDNWRGPWGSQPSPESPEYRKWLEDAIKQMGNNQPRQGDQQGWREYNKQMEDLQQRLGTYDAQQRLSGNGSSTSDYSARLREILGVGESDSGANQRAMDQFTIQQGMSDANRKRLGLPPSGSMEAAWQFSPLNPDRIPYPSRPPEPGRWADRARFPDDTGGGPAPRPQRGPLPPGLPGPYNPPPWTPQSPQRGPLPPGLPGPYNPPPAGPYAPQPGAPYTAPRTPGQYPPQPTGPYLPQPGSPYPKNQPRPLPGGSMMPRPGLQRRRLVSSLN